MPTFTLYYIYVITVTFKDRRSLLSSGLQGTSEDLEQTIFGKLRLFTT